MVSTPDYEFYILSYYMASVRTFRGERKGFSTMSQW